MSVHLAVDDVLRVDLIHFGEAGLDGFELTGEGGIGEDAGVLEFAETGVGESIEVTVGKGLDEQALPTVCLLVLRLREPRDEVGRSIVTSVFNEMMADAVFAGLGVDRSGSIESERHEDMTFLPTLAELGIVSALGVGVGTLTGRAVVVGGFCAIGFKEIAVWVSPSDVAVCLFLRDELTSLCEEPEAGWFCLNIFHKHRLTEGC